MKKGWNCDSNEDNRKYNMYNSAIPIGAWPYAQQRKWLVLKFRLGTYRKIPKISPGAYNFQRPFLRGLFLEGLIYGQIFVFQDQLGYPYSWKEIYPFCFLLLLIWGQFPSTHLEGRFNRGFFALRAWGAYIWRGLYMKGLIFRILRYVPPPPFPAKRTSFLCWQVCYKRTYLKEGEFWANFFWKQYCHTWYLRICCVLSSGVLQCKFTIYSKTETKIMLA